MQLARLQPTPVYRAYWTFAAERQNIFFKRVHGLRPPWTTDEILSDYKFTNAYRASDRVSQYLIREVIYRSDRSQASDETLFRILLFKLFNKIETWELIENELGVVTWKGYEFRRYDRLLQRARKNRNPIYSAAYIMPSCLFFGENQKHRNHLRLVELMMTSGLSARLTEALSMSEAYRELLKFPSIGPFLAYQYVTDINYSSITDFSEMEFVVPGPGAIDGIRKCFYNPGVTNDTDIIRLMSDIQEEEFERLGLKFPYLWGRRLQLIDCQNLFCEVGKYARVAFPNARGSSLRSRIKQKFQPTSTVISYWYPPKWGINTNIRKFQEQANSVDQTSVSEKMMDFRSYQVQVNKTDTNPGTDPESLMIPLCGLATETGELLAQYKKYLRDGASHHLFKERFKEEVGDILWYLANVATKFGIGLEDAAFSNLEKTAERWGPFPTRKPFDVNFPSSERLPRRIIVKFSSNLGPRGKAIRVSRGGKQFGDELTDNARHPDGYGFHDIIHLAFAAVLGWSPLARTMLKAKRKSDLEIDEVEDGGRAIAVEEGIATMIFAYARDYNFLEGKSSVSAELLRMIKNMVRHLEVSVCTTGEWESAIVQGFGVWRAIKVNGGGTVEANLDKRTLTVKRRGRARANTRSRN